MELAGVTNIFMPAPMEEVPLSAFLEDATWEEQSTPENLKTKKGKKLEYAMYYNNKCLDTLVAGEYVGKGSKQGDDSVMGQF